MAADKENAADSANKEGDKKKSDPLQKAVDKEKEMTEEDIREKEELDACVEQLASGDAAVVQSTLVTVTEKLKTATSTMTSVPRPLKFLRPHYEKLKEIYAATPHRALKP